jgi:uncharacterized protein YjiK
MFDLPSSLREVSAVTSVDAHTVACLQDEKGVLFYVDVRDGRVRGSLVFGPDGDYEGLARVGSEFFVLRSDGMLARLARTQRGFRIAESFSVATASQDLEGLCHDASRGMLLLAPKDVVKAEPVPDTGKRGDKRRREEARRARDQRVLFGWDLAQRALAPEPVLRLSLSDLRAQAEQAGGERIEKGSLKLHFSCVAIHPRTGELHLLSAADRVLVAIDPATRRLQDIYWLDGKVLPQPEGITFLPNGDLVVSSEGVDGPARLAVYRQRAAH